MCFAPTNMQVHYWLTCTQVTVTGERFSCYITRVFWVGSPGGYFPCQNSCFTEKYLLSLKHIPAVELFKCLDYNIDGPKKYSSAVGSLGDGTASPEELRRTLGYSDPAGHPVSQQADWDRCPQKTQLHPRSGTALKPTVCVLVTTVSQCALLNTLSNGLFIYLSGDYYRVEEALIIYLSFAFHVL